MSCEEKKLVFFGLFSSFFGCLFSRRLFFSSLISSFSSGGQQIFFAGFSHDFLVSGIFIVFGHQIVWVFQKFSGFLGLKLCLDRKSVV